MSGRENKGGGRGGKKAGKPEKKKGSQPSSSAPGSSKPNQAPISSATSSVPHNRNHKDKGAHQRQPNAKAEKKETRETPVFANFTSPVEVLTRWLSNEDSYWLVQELSQGSFKRQDGTETFNIEQLGRYFSWDSRDVDLLSNMVQLLFSMLSRDSVINSVQQDCVNIIYTKLLRSDLLDPDTNIGRALLRLVPASTILANQLAVVLEALIAKLREHCFGSLPRFVAALRPHDRLVPALQSIIKLYKELNLHYIETGALPGESGAHELKDNKFQKKANQISSNSTQQGNDENNHLFNDTHVKARYIGDNDPQDDEIGIMKSAFPSLEEIESKESLPVRSLPALSGERFLSKDHYLDTQWRMLRADALEDIRSAIREIKLQIAKHEVETRRALAQRKPLPPFKYPRSTSFFAYTNVQIESFAQRRMRGGANEASFVVAFDLVTSRGIIPSMQQTRSKRGQQSSFSNASQSRSSQSHPPNAANAKKFEWTLSKRLMPGSLVALSCDKFKNTIWGTVGNRDEELLQKGCVVLIIDLESITKFDQSQTYEMLETRAFWTSYRYVLDRLASYHFSTTIMIPKDKRDEDGNLIPQRRPGTYVYTNGGRRGYPQLDEVPEGGLAEALFNEWEEQVLPPPAFPLPDIIIYSDYTNLSHTFDRLADLSCVATDPQRLSPLRTALNLPARLPLPANPHPLAANLPLAQLVVDEDDDEEDSDDDYEYFDFGDGAPLRVLREGRAARPVRIRDVDRLAQEMNQVNLVEARQVAPNVAAALPPVDPAYPQGNTILDEAQWFALKSILTQKVSVVQGPPGTGKTFLGLKAAKILLAQFDGPILCVCYTNHALDQFLEGILKFEQNIVRIGGRCKAESLEAYNLQKLMPATSHSFSVSALVRKREACRELITQSYKLSNSSFAPIYAFFKAFPILYRTDATTQEDYIRHMLKLLGLATIEPETENRHHAPQSAQSSQSSKATFAGGNLSSQPTFNMVMEDLQDADSDADSESEVLAELEARDIDDMQEEPEWMNQLRAEAVKQPTRGSSGASKASTSNASNSSSSSSSSSSHTLDSQYLSEQSFSIELDWEDGLDNIEKPYAAVPILNRNWMIANADPDRWISEFGPTYAAWSEQDVRIWQSNLKGAAGPRGVEEARNLTHGDWRGLLVFWMDLWKRSIANKVSKESLMFEKIVKKIVSYQEDAKVDFLRKKRVIGMTTTGAAKQAGVLQALGCKVVIIEEAAEIFEAHAIACLTSSVEKLVLIGDHFQLRPKITHFPLAKRGLDISLFERLIISGFPFVSLRQQHRMHPEISHFLSPIYPSLYDGPKTLERPDFTSIGLSQRVTFFSHPWREVGGNADDEISLSKRNEKEALFIFGFVRFLLAQHIDPERIAIITMYQGQRHVLKDMMKRSSPLTRDFPKSPFIDTRTPTIRVCCVDDYQGEENDIIILSLVRSNAEGSIGFVRTKNRVCVSLSRARCSLFIFGSADTIIKHNEDQRKRKGKHIEAPIWHDILQLMDHRQVVKKSIDLTCSKHPKRQIIMKEPEDWVKSITGCPESCHEKMECGHVCQAICHGALDHPNCFKDCERVFDECGHRCPKRCYQDCGDCVTLVPKHFPSCGHTERVQCSKEEEATCHGRCVKKLSCGHDCPKMCFQRCETKCLEPIFNFKLPCGHVLPKIECCYTKDVAYLNILPHPCGAQLEGCRHTCAGNCVDCRTTTKHQPCLGKCERPLACGHLCEGNCSEPCPPCEKKCQLRCAHSLCGKHDCGTRCTPCMEKCRWSCPHHQCKQLCSDLCDRGACNEPCQKLLKCNHPCLGLCGETCPNVCYKCTPDMEVFGGAMMGAPLKEDEPYATKFIFLESCRHSVAVESMDGWMQSLDNYDKAITMPTCPLCTSPINNDFGRYSNFLKKRKSDLDSINIKYAKDHINMLFKRKDYAQAISAIKSLHTQKRFGRSQSPPSKFVDMLLIHAMCLTKTGASNHKIETICNQVLAIDPTNAEAKKITGGLLNMDEIVQAMRVEIHSGGWYKCPNGHLFAIGECGGAMETSKCVDCGATVGGANHATVAGVTHSNVDGSAFPAWGDQANMNNYRF